MAKKKKDHGWSNDVTWSVASTMENNEAIHETMINEASLAIGNALESDLNDKDSFSLAVVNLSLTMRNRYAEVLDRITSASVSILKHSDAQKDEREIASSVLMIARTTLGEVDWHEIAMHYASAFMQ